MQYVVFLEVDDDFIDDGDDSIEFICSRVNDLLEDSSNTHRAKIRPLSEIIAC